MAKTIIAGMQPEATSKMDSGSRVYADFSDPEVVLVHAGNGEHCASYWAEDSVGQHQTFDGPTYLVVGKRANDDQLGRAAARYQLDISQLRNFRDGSAERMKMSRQDCAQSS